MMKPVIAFALALSAVTAPVIAGGLTKEQKQAQERRDQQEASAAMARGEILPIARMLDAATAAVPGDVLKVKLERKASGFQYEVKVLARDGRVREIHLDARTARVLSVEDD
jgi:uncharacterized membrane protein YkoI